MGNPFRVLRTHSILSLSAVITRNILSDNENGDSRITFIGVLGFLPFFKQRYRIFDTVSVTQAAGPEKNVDSLVDGQLRVVGTCLETDLVVEFFN